ncbi:anti-sigma factor domain-containing protein [Brevibacillus borstelensis]|uniref:anti-sigma factor n=1 Tax=Brevibacillus borstelensis TaxID=45462 RepID=UPI0030BC588C
MQSQNRCLSSDVLVAYIIGECSEQEKHEVDTHLTTCAVCRQEAKELQEAWDLIPYELEEVEVPDELKNEVMSAIFAPAKNPPKAAKDSWFHSLGPRFTGLLPARRWVVAGLLLALAGTLWNNLALRDRLSSLEQQTKLPTSVIQVYALQPTENSGPEAKGNAWLFTQGNSQHLVFHLQGLPATKGTETYQVWLIHEGKRRSAGVFHVDPAGTGILTYQMSEQQLPFDAIGITLEPDADGEQPRGKKVLGT